MHCRHCELKAVIYMRQHKLGVCKTHYLEWVLKQTQRFINLYEMFAETDRILVAVSGGKDSLALWDILQQLGYNTTGLYIGLGIDEGIGYSEESLKLSETFAAKRGLDLRVVAVGQEYGATIPEIAKTTQRGKGKPCSVCGLTKRHIMNKVARDGKFDILVTGHNLDDEAAVLFGNTLNWLSGYLLRQGPVLEARGGLIRKTKPLCRFYEREMAAYALLRGIEYIYEECPHAKGAKTIYYKELLNQLEAERPGAKMYFYLNFLKAKERGLFNTDIEAAPQVLGTCQSCGQPTSAPELCSFCRLMDNVRRET